MVPTPQSLPFFFSSCWELLPTRMPKTVDGFSAVVDNQKKSIIVIGGHGGDSFCQAFHIQSQTWMRMPLPPTEHPDGATVWCNGKVYTMGGFDMDGVINTVECIELDQDTGWRDLPPMPTKRWGFTTVVVDHDILAIGGEDWAVVERYDMNKQVWSRLPNMLESRLGCASAVVNKKVYVFGGLCGSRSLDTAEVYDTTTCVWESLPVMPCVRVHAAAVAVGPYVLLMGGNDENEQSLDRVDCFDTVTHQWHALASLCTPRWGCAAVLVDNHVFVVGGINGVVDEHDNVLDSMEMIDIHPYYTVVPRLLPLMKEEVPLGLWPYILADCPLSVVFFILCSERFKLDSILLSCYKAKEEV